jgi:hypothetical protein
MMLSISGASSSGVRIGRDAGWLLTFHRETRDGIDETPACELSRDDYYAEIHATLPAGAEGGSYTFVVEGLSDDHYASIRTTGDSPPGVVRLYLYYRDLELPDLGIATNVLGSDFINAGASNSKAAKHEADRIATLRVQSVTRKAGARRYETTITARELIFDLIQGRRPCGDTPIDALQAEPAVAELMRRAWRFPDASVPFKYYAPTPRTNPAPPAPADQPEHDYLDARQSILAGLQHIAGSLELGSNRYGRGMLLIRDGTLHVGQRPVPLSGKDPVAVTVSNGLLEVESLGVVDIDPHWEPCAHDQKPSPTRRQFRLTLRGRPDLKPGDVVTFDAPAGDESKTKGPLGGALGALGDLGAAVVDGIASIAGGNEMKSPVQLYVSSVEHRLGRASGFLTTLTGVQIGEKSAPEPDDAWDAQTPAPEGRTTGAAPPEARGTVAAEAADAVVTLFRREASTLASTDVGEVRSFREKSVGAQPGQVSEVFRGLVALGGPNLSRRADIKRPSDAPSTGVPYLTPFAWGRCGLILPRYPGMRVALTHRAFDAADAIDLGALWQTGHAPEGAHAGDWWLSLPADAAAGNAPDAAQSGPPSDYAGAATHDLIDSGGQRIIEVGALVVRLGHSKLTPAGTRPDDPPTNTAVTITHATSGAHITIKDNGTVVIKGAQINLEGKVDVS